MSELGLPLSRGVHMAIRLKPGEDPVVGLRAAVAASGAAAAAVVTCVGSLTRAAIRHANRPDVTFYDGHFEITALVGTLDPLGGHLHLSIADGEGRAFGGHLMPGSRIYTTVEIVLVLLPDLAFSRAPCAESGYNELVIARREAAED